MRFPIMSIVYDDEGHTIFTEWGSRDAILIYLRNIINPSCHLLAPSPALPVNGEGVGRRPPPVYGGIEGGRLDAIPNFE
ncbi:hypothetical protein CCP3SC1_560023 [Gammaproteobacteria bacterium]